MQGRTTIRAPSVQTPKKRSNLRDVAKAAGVSVATVSRVLNAPALVSGETRDRVLSVIETLHFVPSAAARAINSGRTRMVGALVPTLDNAIFARFLSSLEEGLGNFGLSLVVATTDGNDETEAAKAERLVNIGVEALIVSGITHSARFDELIQRTQLPAVATSYFDPAYHLPTVGYDNAAAAALALDHLIALGHRDIAVIHGPAAQNDRTRARLRGLEQAAADARLRYFPTDITMQGGATAAQGYLATGRNCTAVLCLSDVLAMSVLFELRRHGISVPASLSVMGVDDLPASAHIVPRLTSVQLPVSRMGHETASAVASWIEKQIVPQSLLLPSRLIIRESTQMVSSA
jgi:LacI family transcriptional regulator